MSAAPHIELSAGYPCSQIATRAHSSIEISGEINELTKIRITTLAKISLWQADNPASASPEPGTLQALAYRHTSTTPGSRPPSRSSRSSQPRSRGAVLCPFRPFPATKTGECASAGNIKEALAGAECGGFLVDQDGMGAGEI